MNKRLMIFLVCVLLFVILSRADTGLGNVLVTIPVTGADAVFEPSLLTESGFAVDLKNLINSLPLMLIQVRSSNATLWTEFVPISSQPVLSSLLNNLPNYYIPLRSADKALISTPFIYPSELLQDHMPPIISNVQIEPITGLVGWDTDEYATSEARFGLESGNYSHVITETTWKNSHLLLPSTGSWNYILISSTDRSGNKAEYYIPGFTITGSVKDVNNHPILGAVISISATMAVVTDLNGNYSLGGVPSGEYSLTVSHSQYHFTPNVISLIVSGNLTEKNFIGENNTRMLFLPFLRNK